LKAEKKYRENTEGDKNGVTRMLPLRRLPLRGREEVTLTISSKRRGNLGQNMISSEPLKRIRSSE